jgi:hypothetical protein
LGELEDDESFEPDEDEVDGVDALFSDAAGVACFSPFSALPVLSLVVAFAADPPSTCRTCRFA